MNELRYLRGYPEHILVQVQRLLAEQRLGTVLSKRYPQQHQIRSDAALYSYVMELKQRYLRKSDPLAKVLYDDRIAVERDALGTHTRVSRVHGGKLKAKKEIRIDSRFRDLPPQFLRMICVHELAHLKELEHNKAFYNLCQHMEPDYFQLELDLRLWLTQLDVVGTIAG